MNLVLSLAALGRNEEANRQLGEVTRWAPGVLWAAKESLSQTDIASKNLRAMLPVLERALEMMQGNRSSTVVTYFNQEGALCSPASPQALRALTSELTDVLHEIA